MSRLIRAVQAVAVAWIMVGTEVRADDEPLFVSVERLTLESALRVAQGAINACRAEGLQIAATVIDRNGRIQVQLRDVLAPHVTGPISERKAIAAMAFNLPTSELDGRFTSPFSVGKFEEFVMSAGAVPIEAGGVFYGAVGVSGAPSGETDEECAAAGVDSIRDDLEMSQ